MSIKYRMLEDPSYESIVRWGEGGESFVVLEVCDPEFFIKTPLSHINSVTEREVYEIDPSEAFQAQQFR